MNIIIACVSFLLMLISVFFGVSIHNANANMHITYLNEMDNIHYYDVDLVPQLTRQAAIFTFPLILGILVMEIIVLFKSRVKQVKNIAIGLTGAVFVLFIIDILVLSNPQEHDFSAWGYFWIIAGLFCLAGNALSVFVKGNKTVA